VIVVAFAVALSAQQRDTVTLPPVTVSVTRIETPVERIPWAVVTIAPSAVARGRPAWGLDEVLSLVPGVFVANRYNFSLDQRLSIRGFGARSAFAVRGVKLLMDGIPLSLPDGQGQLTTVDLGSVGRIEVLRGTASALFGNAAGGVISLSTDAAPSGLEVRTTAGAFDRELERSWSKWQVGTGFRLGAGQGQVTASRLAYEGERDHTNADVRTMNARVRIPIGGAWVLTLLGDGGDAPRADNPGALTLAELRANRDSAAGLNVLRVAGKAARQLQGGLSLRGRAAEWDVSLAAFALDRNLDNPLPQGYIMLGRTGWGARSLATRHFQVAGKAARLSVGVDAQWQYDDRHEYAYSIPNAALTTPNNTRDTLTRSQLERVSELGPFAQAALDLVPRLTVTAGLRHDRVHFGVEDRLFSDGADNSGGRTLAATSGSFGVAFLPSAGVTLYANAGTSFETPTTTELNNQPPPGGGGFNFSLEPQRAASYEIGARGAAATMTWSAAVFQADVKDELVSFEDSTVPGRRYFRNAASARHRGVEVGASARLIDAVSLSFAWTFSDYRYRSHQVGAAVLDGRAIPGIPRNVLHGSLRVEPASWRGIWGVVDLSQASGVFVDDTLTVRTDSWSQLDLRLGWEGRVGRGRLAPVIAVNNVLNAHYVGSVVINAARGRYYEPAPGRNAYFGLQITTSAHK